MTTFKWDDGTDFDSGALWGDIPSTGLQFFDETTINTLQPGLFATIYNTDDAGNPTTIQGSGWTQADGSVQGIAIEEGNTYHAVLIGPAQFIPPTPFTGAAGPTQVAVAGYRSRLLSQTNYAQEACNLIPTGSAWPGDAARQPGGSLWALMFAGAWIRAENDAEIVDTLASERLWGCTGSNLDSWAMDFLGQWLPRYQAETDDSFRARIYSVLSNGATTQKALQAIVVAFYNAIANEVGQSQSENSSADDQGGADTRGGADVSQGWTPSTPSTVLVFDRQDNPLLSNQYNVNPNNNDGSFVVMVGFSVPNNDAWYLDHGHLDYESFVINAFGQYILSSVAPDPRLGALVNLLKANGTKPLYLTAITNP